MPCAPCCPSYVEVVRVLPALPDAHGLEKHLRTVLREAGIAATQGREYFDSGALALVLDVVDGWAAAHQYGEVAGPEPPVIDAPMPP